MSDEHPNIPYAQIPEPRNKYEMEDLCRNPANAMLLLCQRQVAAVRPALVEAYTRMGMHDKALAVAETDEEKARVELVRDAILEDDDKRCECVHEVDVADYVRETPEYKVEPKMVRMPHYLRHGQFFSPKHGKVIDLYICHKCGHPNAIDGSIDGPGEVHHEHDKGALKALHEFINSPGAYQSRPTIPGTATPVPNMATRK
jgi:hypothetical protein